MKKATTRLEKLLRLLKVKNRERDREDRKFARRLAYGFRLIGLVEG